MPFVWSIGLGCGFLNTWGGGLGFAAITLAIWLFFEFRAFFLRVAVIGADGVAVRGVLYRRFVPFADVRAIDYSSRGPVLCLASGAAPVALPILSMVFPTRVEKKRSEDAWKRLQAAWATVRFGTALPPWAMELARAGRTFSAWRRACAAFLSANGPAYRTRARDVSSEELLALLERPGAPLELRIGALFALGGVEGASHRARAAAEDAAHPAIREALKAALRGELDEGTFAAALALEHKKRN